MLSHFAYAGLSAVGLPQVARRLRKAGVILCYHNVVADASRGGSGAPGVHMPLERFGTQMEWLASRYDVIPLSALLERLDQKLSIARTACVTFDDAYAGVFTHAWPVLRALDITPTVFVVTTAAARRRPFWWDHPAVTRVTDNAHRQQWLEELGGDEAAIFRTLGVAADGADRDPASLPAGWDEIRRAAAAGVEIGAHSNTHRTLPTLSDAELVGEIVEHRNALGRELGTAPACFAFPYGKWNGRVRNAVREAGYRAGVTLDYGLVTADADSWSLPRINIPAGITDAAYHAWTAGLSLAR